MPPARISRRRFGASKRRRDLSVGASCNPLAHQHRGSKHRALRSTPLGSLQARLCPDLWFLSVIKCPQRVQTLFPPNGFLVFLLVSLESQATKGYPQKNGTGVPWFLFKIAKNQSRPPPPRFFCLTSPKSHQTKARRPPATAQQSPRRRVPRVSDVSVPGVPPPGHAPAPRQGRGSRRVQRAPESLRGDRRSKRCAWGEKAEATETRMWGGGGGKYPCFGRKMEEQGEKLEED